MHHWCYWCKVLGMTRRSVDLRPEVEAAVREYQALLMKAERRSVSFNEALNLLIEGFLQGES